MDGSSNAFPRGFSSSKPSGESKKRALPNKDELFSSSNKRAKKIEVVTKKKPQSNNDKPLPSIGLGITASNKDVSKIKFVQKDDIKTGVFFLGFVLQIEEKSAVISGPNGNTAILHVQNVSDVIHEICARRDADESNSAHQSIPDLRHLLQLHQPIRCCVLPATEKRDRLQVSCRSSLINRGLALKHLAKGFLLSGCISSIEDHGCIVSTGLPDINFFLPKRGKEDISFLIGQPIDCIVDDINTESRTVTLMQRKNNYYDAPLATKSLPFLALSPGMLFEVLVDKKVSTGYIVNYLSLFHGVIDRYSTYKIYSDSEWEELGNKQNTLLARIIFIDHASKTVRLSCRPHIISLRKPTNLPALGTTLENGSVILRSKLGAFLRINGKDSSEETQQQESADGRIKKKQRKQVEEEAHQEAEKTLNIVIKATELADVSPDGTEGNDEEEESEEDSSDDDSKKNVSKSQGEEPIKKHKIHNVYTVGRVVPVVRVQGLRLVEGIIIASNMKKYTETDIMHVSDVKPGQILPVEVSSITPSGLMVTIAGRIPALCPVVHTSDSATVETKLSKKFSVGQKLTMRVLNISHTGRVIMTHKKSLVDLPEESIFTDINHVSERQETTAVVESIDEKGVGLRFFCDVHGLLPLSVLMKQGVLNPKEAYRIGQVVRVITLTTIHSVTANSSANGQQKKKQKKSNYNRESMGKVLCALAFVFNEEKLSELLHTLAQLLPNKDQSEKTPGDVEEQQTQVVAGKDAATAEFEFVSGAVMGITEDSLLVRLDDGRSAVLPKIHCHDFGFAAASLNIKDKANYPYKVGTRVEQALVLGTTKKNVLITIKPLLVKAAKRELGEDVIFPVDGHGVSQGSVCVGYVKKVDDFGVIVGFRGRLAALIPRANLADRFVSAEERLFEEGDSVRCVVQKVDLATQRYLLSTKPSVVPKSANQHRHFHAYLYDKYVSTQRESMANGKLLPDWKTYRVGSVVKATVSTIEDYGVVFLGQDQTTMMLDRQVDASTVAVGKAFDVLIVDVDYEHSVLIVKKLDKADVKTYNKPAKAAVTIGVSQEVTIERITDQYLVVNNGGLVGFAPVADFHVTRPDVSSFAVGDKVQATLQVVVKSSAESDAVFPHAEVSLFALDDLSVVYGASSTSNNNNKKKAANKAAETPAITVQEGDLLEGELDLRKTYSLEPPAFRVRLANGIVARLCFTEVAEPSHWEDYADIVALWRSWQDEDDEDEDKAALQEEHLATLRRLRKRHVQHGQATQVRVLSVNGHRIDVSMRASRIHAQKIGQQTKADAMPTVGTVVRAFVHNVGDKGCFVRLSQGLKGRSLIKDLADTFVENPEEAFPAGMLVSCRVSSVDMLRGTVSVVLKDSVVRAAEENKRALQKLRAGMTVKGRVETVKDVGVFVRIDGTNVVGLARAVAALQDASKTLQEEYAAGDVVRARVLKVSPASQRVALGLREKYFRSDYEVEDIVDAHDDNSDSDEGSAQDEDGEEDDGSMDVDEDEDDDDEEDDDDDDDDEESSDEEEEEEEELPVKKRNAKAATAAATAAVAAVTHSSKYDASDIGEAVGASTKSKRATAVAAVAATGGKKKKRKLGDVENDHDDDDLGDLDWGDQSRNTSNKKSKTTTTTELVHNNKEDSEDDFGGDDSDDNDDNDASVGGGKDKKSSKKRDSERKKQEKDLRTRELALAEGRLLPDSVNDFERLIIGQPNSSFLWIQYLAFHVKNADIDAARVIANRALRTIHFREEDEKFNVWVALLNMEYRYGSRESFERSLVQAVNESKGKLIFLSLASTMEQSNDTNGAEQLFEKALKRPQFRKSKKVWMAYHLLKLKAGDVAGAKAQLSRSLQALSPHKHVEVIRSFAIAEFDHGSIDRGRVLLEELLSNYPKRNDLWNIYVDKEVKLGNIAQARQLFERMIALKVSPKIMQTVFKKYMTFESKHGDARSQELVKEKAREYVNSLA